MLVPGPSRTSEVSRVARVSPPPGPQPSGRLELTWTNKHLQLLAHEDGSYEWLDPSDYRVAEVRLLHDLGTVGQVSRTRAVDNLLIRGDALHALTSLARLPEFSREYLGKVKLAYLDPPFNTGQAFEHYDDALEHSVWLTMMRDRLVQIWELLASDGSVWLHLDDSEAAYARVMMDEIFGRQNFVASVVWQRTTGTRKTDIASSHDYILVFAKDRSRFAAGCNGLPRTDVQLGRFKNPDNDPRGPWRQGADSMTPGLRAEYPITLPSGRVVRPTPGNHWRCAEDTFKQALADNRVYFGKDGNSLPIVKTYLSDVTDDVTPSTWWTAAEVGTNQEAKRDHLGKMFPGIEGFATPKPERLLRRIVDIATNLGEIVLDCFAGSGTAPAVAQKMGRRWVAIERESDTIRKYAVPRLKKVIEGEESGGVTNEVGWQGGGGFRVLDVAPSMFEADEGLVCLAEGMTNGQLAEVTAAQLGFEYQADPPFAGRKGRSRLAVVDGVVNAAVVRLLAQALDATERVIICGTGIATDARPILRELRSGSTLRKIPAALLSEYRATRATFSKSAADEAVPAEVDS
jgi:adenine-specific DNA-methyltransferase